ncbi:hypothetical protein JOD97_004347 [Duganella sp. 1411]|jgi:hypothetical protein|uniref:RusA family crossover junction endodeoxyribonuclease n=1 Tax=Duganella sp. 1411 TaxID=2806572 RepID=UPI001AE43313|nr:RusA family crossover junction endodeoxyribonuclease [Duganella sp. 1411]MBP1206274.1 hypothetical protein [Duganella sp. 1411]
MPLIVDFVLPRRPVSHQTKDASQRRAWSDYIYGRARLEWPARPLMNYPLRFTMVYLYDVERPGDINNFVKPVQDALCTLIYADDSMIRDVSAHMRFADVKCDKDGLPAKLAHAIDMGQACVYVAISDSRELAEEVK